MTTRAIIRDAEVINASSINPGDLILWGRAYSRVVEIRHRGGTMITVINEHGDEADMSAGHRVTRQCGHLPALAAT